MLTIHKEIFEACSSDPPLLYSVKLAYEKLKIKEGILDTTTGNTPLHTALMYGADLELVQYLVSIDKSWVKTTNFKRLSPIHLACNGPNSSVEIVSFLVDQWEGSLRVGTGLGNLPLHVACASRAPLSLVRYLLEKHDRAKFVLNKHRQTPLDCAMSEDKKPALPHVVAFLGGDMKTVEERFGEMITVDTGIPKPKSRLDRNAVRKTVLKRPNSEDLNDSSVDTSSSSFDSSSSFTVADETDS